MKRLNYCSSCGRELILKTLLDGSKEKWCPDCGHVFFDEPSPAVIVAVTNSDRILLTGSVGWKYAHWGLVAGHVESGETAEETAMREVHEEVGLNISELEILGTYAIRSRGLLMIGFRAETKGTNITKSRELKKAEWFRLHEPLPLHPDSVSAQIARKICPQLRLTDSK
jgi:NAD+ diphosphatase